MLWPASNGCEERIAWNTHSFTVNWVQSLQSAPACVLTQFISIGSNSIPRTESTFERKQNSEHSQASSELIKAQTNINYTQKKHTHTSKVDLEKGRALTCTWNFSIESSSIWTFTSSFLPLRLPVDADPSTPDGVLSECVIREPDACDGAIIGFVHGYVVRKCVPRMCVINLIPRG